MKDIKKNTIIRILKLTKPHWKLLAGFTTAIAFTAFLDSLGTYITKLIIDNGIMVNNLDKVIYYSKIFGLVYLLNSISFFIFIYCAGRLGDWMQYDLRAKLFNH
ncbi:MAG: hypothetical protein L3J12_10680, partial [Spirochaetales bacterium]|nr:hypothetical protein [Spirochaetales bacterium]